MADSSSMNTSGKTVMDTLRMGLGEGGLAALSDEHTLRLDTIANTPTVPASGKAISQADLATLRKDAVTVFNPVAPGPAVIGDALARSSEYVLREALGQGGMGQIFLAEQTGLQRDVAVKKIIPERLNG